MKINLQNQDIFENRHHGKDEVELQEMLNTVGVSNLDELIDQTIPAAIRLEKPLNLPNPKSEQAFLANIKKIARKNVVFKSYIGGGYYDTITPNVILRNILENPAWYTAYTPYQAEIAQGRLEMLLNFQTVVTDLTGMEIANASLLDEATAAAEAMTMFHAVKSSSKKGAGTFFVSELCHPQTIDLIHTRAKPIGIKVVVGDHTTLDFANKDLYGVLVQYPAANGEIYDYAEFIKEAHANSILVAVAADLLSLAVLRAPGKMGADVVVGSSQRFGVPMGYGGPHAAFFATRESFKRNIPGRIIGVSVDKEGNRALRMALQTREQHIRREKATSNICTAQVLLAVIAAGDAVYHGPEGIRNIATRIHGLARLFADTITKFHFKIVNTHYFDTVTIETPLVPKLKEQSEKWGVNLKYNEDKTVSVSIDEAKTFQDVIDLLNIFAEVSGFSGEMVIEDVVEDNLPESLLRQSDYLTHPIFNTHHTEHEMLRYLKMLENKDLSLVHSMISLGSCTMKLNATAEMIPLTWPEFGNIHPLAPTSQVGGYAQMIIELNAWLCEITGFAAMSFQPNSGAQGEYAGLMAIRAYHESKGEAHRNIALIPASAHGTNPASAVMAGMKVIVTKCDERGNIDVADLKSKTEQYADNLSCLLVTYPSTHGVYEESIIEICAMIHENGGQVYMDGANMNAQVGLTSPASIGADVCHLNLHKTFCIPHGGGGPGVGPIGVAEHLVPYLPSHVSFSKLPQHLEKGQAGAVSAAPYGSASILTISYAYIAMMGSEGLTRATKYAILNANYIKARLNGHYDVLYTGQNGRCAHEMILDCRPFKSAGIEAEDLAKRLMDYGFHAPTLSFPVAGTLMIEPTESESKAELDRFCDTMIAIRSEIAEVENGVADKLDNVLKNAPHTMRVVIDENWSRSYSREKAVFPLEHLRFNKFWPSVSRVDSAYGDRNLICSCIPIEDYAEETV